MNPYTKTPRSECVKCGQLLSELVDGLHQSFDGGCYPQDLGVDPYTVDKVIAGFGMPMGPFRQVL